MAEEIKQAEAVVDTKSVIKKKYRNPFPGLRPFSMDESHLFFGREGQSDEVLRKLSENKFVAVIGSSGSGKSSFIYCGVIPILYGGFLTKIGTNWDVLVTRPGGGPMDNMAEAILKKDNDYKSMDADDKILRKTIVSTLLRSSSLGLVEAMSKYTDVENKNVLIIVDQFEELFRFKKNEEGGNGSSESLAFVNMLVETIQQNEAPIFVAITMRSDFIGDCAQFPSLTRLINQSNYLIPQMTREQKRSAIVGPISVGGAKISSRLLQQLLSDLGENTDQLPILAHSLMRTFDYWTENHELNEPIDLQHYEAIGTMSGALSQHANEAYDELNTREKEICAVMFRCLTERTGDTDGIRRPTRLSLIAQIAECSEDEVIKIVEVFRKTGRSLLMPPVGTHLNSNSIIDISHESLMRIWVRLKNWVDEEGQAVDMYLRLSDAAAKYQTGKTGLWRPPDLQLALNWQEKNNPTLVWAQRYNPAFERTMVFLETSKKTFETEQKVKEEMQRKRLRNSRNVTAVMTIIALLAMVAMVFSYIQYLEADTQKLMAEAQKREADKQKEIAKQKEKEALKAKDFAELKEKEANIQKEEAHRQTQIATQAAEEANRQKAIAQESAAEARRQTKIAEEQKSLALSSQVEALKQQKLAERSATDAYKQRILSIAQAMAVKSLQIYDTTTKVLVAQQAYIFNRDYQGNPHNHDVYDALYYAVKQLYHDQHNSLKGHTDAVRSVVFSSTGKEMYTAGSDGKILKWIVQDGQFTSIKFHQNNFVNRIIKISNDDKWLALAGEEPYIQLFDLTNPNAKPRKLYGHKGKIWSIAFSNDNQSLVSSGEDSSIFVRNVENDKYYLVAKATSKVRTISVSPDGKSVAGGDDKGQVILWDMNRAKDPINLHIKNMKKIHAVAYSNNGKMLAIGDELGSIKIWDLEKSVPIANPTGHRARINDLKFDPKDEVLASASFDGSVRLWDINHLNEQPIVLRDHNSWVWSLAFTPSGDKVITGCVDNLIRIYPTRIDEMAAKICNQIKRNMTPDEWNLFVAKDIKYEQTCAGLPEGKNKELE
jgi:WD40 repeat protein/energy-coupling factor transporter ATP-binding protein EcfA2